MTLAVRIFKLAEPRIAAEWQTTNRMNLESVLAGFQGMAERYANELPLLAVNSFVPGECGKSEKEETGTRRLVAAFLYWLISRHHLSSGRSSQLSEKIKQFNAGELSASELLQGEFSDCILDADVEAGILGFCRDYLASSAGGLAADYHELFVENTNLRSFLDVAESSGNFETISLLIDERFRAFLDNEEDWATERPARARPSAARFHSFEDWAVALRTFKDLAETPAGRYKTRVRRYWALIDAAKERPNREVTQELVQTYLKISDLSVQESVWRILRSFPWPLVFGAILENIEELKRSTDWTPSLVDIFDAELPDGVLDAMIRELRKSPLCKRTAYLEALESVRINGSVHATCLLNNFYRAEGVING